MTELFPNENTATRATARGAILTVAEGKAELARLRSYTIWRRLNEAANGRLDHHALVGASDQGEVKRMTYRELLARTVNFSAGLAGMGVRRGDRVALWMTNTFEWVISALAIMRIGASVVPVNTFLKPPEIKYFFQQSGARHLIMIDGFRALKMPELLAEICPEVARATTPGFVFSDELPDLRNIVIYSRSGGKLDCAFDFDALGKNASQGDHALANQMERETQSSDLAMVKYTSGSTAFPKGVMLDHGNIVANAVLHARRMIVDGDDIYFSMMPFFHGGGTIYGMMTMLMHGGSLVFTEAFNAALAAELIVAEQATVFATMLGNEVVQAALAKNLVFSSVRFADIPDEASRKVMPNVKSGFCAYGITEAVGPVSMAHLPFDHPRIGNGRLLEGNEARIVDPDTGEELAAGVPGELLVRGNLARGYWNKPEETARAFTRDGWLRTEDLCSIDADGNLTWHGRLKLMLKVGGENVSIEEVERVVTSHEAVAHCGAIGVSDKRKGEAVRIYISLWPGRSLIEEELRNWLQPRLAHFKLPREIVFMDALPFLGSGKVDRVSLAKMAKAEAEASA